MENYPSEMNEKQVDIHQKKTLTMMIIKVSTDVTGEDAYMLNVFYGDMPNVIYNTAVYFKNTYAEEWITAPLTREMIQDVDHSTVLESGVIDSPVLGKIPRCSCRAE